MQFKWHLYLEGYFKCDIFCGHDSEGRNATFWLDETDPCPMARFETAEEMEEFFCIVATMIRAIEEFKGRSS